METQKSLKSQNNLEKEEQTKGEKRDPEETKTMQGKEENVKQRN